MMLGEFPICGLEINIWSWCSGRSNFRHEFERKYILANDEKNPLRLILDDDDDEEIKR